MRKLIVLVLASVVLTGCGAKKTAPVVGGGTPAPKPTTPTTPDDSAPPSQPQTPSAEQPPQTSVPAPVPPANQPPVATPPATGSNPPVVVSPLPGSLPNPSPVNPPAPVDLGTSDQVPLGYDPNQFSDFNNSQIGKRYTGAQSDDGYLYTSSSTDALLNYLRSRNNSVSEIQKQVNLKSAAQIVSADLQIDSFSDEALVTLNVLENDEVKTYTLGGTTSNDQMMPLQILKSATSGSQVVSATLKCLDFGGGCKTVLTRLSFGTPGNMAINYVVFRQSLADLYAEFSENAARSKNPEFIKIWEMVSATHDRLRTRARFDDYYLRTFEVVNGRSGFKVEMKARNDQFLGFAGPLLAPAVGTAVKAPVSRMAQKEDLSLDLVRSGAVKYDLLSTIADIKLINNNGLGQFRMQLKMRRYGTQPLDVFNFTFMRRIQPIVDVNDDLLK